MDGTGKVYVRVTRSEGEMPHSFSQDMLVQFEAPVESGKIEWGH